MEWTRGSPAARACRTRSRCRCAASDRSPALRIAAPADMRQRHARSPCRARARPPRIADPRSAWRAPKSCMRLPRERAEHEVQQDAEQKLDVEADAEQPARPFVGRRPRAGRRQPRPCQRRRAPPAERPSAPTNEPRRTSRVPIHGEQVYELRTPMSPNSEVPSSTPDFRDSVTCELGRLFSLVSTTPCSKRAV